MAKCRALKAHSTSVVVSLLLSLPLLACGTTSDAPAGTGGSAGSSAGGSSGGSVSGDAPTWHADIAPLVSEHCQSCHSDGGIAPFGLQTYAQAKMWAGTFEGVLPSGFMPPFLAATTADCQPRFGFKDDLRLTPEEIELFIRWNAAGCPEGDPKTAAAVPAPPQFELTDADVSVKIPGAVTIMPGQDQFICFSLAPDVTSLMATGPEAALLGDRVLIDGVQIHPGNSAIVHHVLVFTDETGQSAALAGDKGYYDCFGGPSSMHQAW